MRRTTERHKRAAEFISGGRRGCGTRWEDDAHVAGQGKGGLFFDSDKASMMLQHKRQALR